MNIHLIRSSELSIDTYTNVLNLLNKTQGPLTYFASKETDWETVNYEKDWITEEQFKKAEQTNFDAERNMNYSLSRPSFTERNVFSCFDDDFPKIEKKLLGMTYFRIARSIEKHMLFRIMT